VWSEGLPKDEIMNSELDTLLNRWRDGSLSEEELRRLTDFLATQEGRAALRHDWFLEEALPEALRTLPLLEMAPRPSWAAQWSAWLRPWTVAAAGREDEPATVVLRQWARGSLAALPLGAAAVVAAAWLAWQEPTATEAAGEPAFIARLMLENQLRQVP
jgi:hypothetical protein